MITMEIWDNKMWDIFDCVDSLEVAFEYVYIWKNGTIVGRNAGELVHLPGTSCNNESLWRLQHAKVAAPCQRSADYGF